jgi:hypothetical protein
MTNLTPIAIDALPGGKSGNTAISARMQEYEKMLSSSPLGKAFLIEVAPNDTSRGTALRISRAATRLHLVAQVRGGTTKEGKAVVGFQVDRPMTPAEIHELEQTKASATK